MREEYDFRGARRGAVAPDAAGKTRITAYLDADVVGALKDRAESESRQADAKIGYQTILNRLLRRALGLDRAGNEETRSAPEEREGPLTEQRLRRVLREEMDREHRQAEEEEDGG